MRALAATLIALALLGVPVAIATTAAASSSGLTASATNTTPRFVGPTPTDRYGGGDWVGVTAGATNFGVLYGTQAHPNAVVIFAEYTRFLGGANILNAQGQQIAVRGVPVRTVMAQSLDRFIEFQTVNVTQGFGLFNDAGQPITVTANLPIKALNLHTGAWNLTSENYTMIGTTFYVNFTIEAANLPYTWYNANVPGAEASASGVLDRVAFTFHLTVDTVQKSLSVPWYTVTVTDSTPREITNISSAGSRTVSGPAVEMGAKYDHLIQGWDFLSNTSKLALETRLIFGNYFPDRTVDFIHEAAGLDQAEAGNGTTLLTNATAAQTPGAPQIYTWGQISFDDAYTRIGEFRWTSNVTVDGAQASMLFQVEGGARVVYNNGEAAFYGFAVRGAYIYPAGQTILHDPSMSAESFSPNVTTGFNLTPLGFLLIQVAVVGVAIIPALYLRSRARRPKPN